MDGTTKEIKVVKLVLGVASEQSIVKCETSTTIR